MDHRTEGNTIYIYICLVRLLESGVYTSTARLPTCTQFVCICRKVIFTPYSRSYPPRDSMYGNWFRFAFCFPWLNHQRCADTYTPTVWQRCTVQWLLFVWCFAETPNSSRCFHPREFITIFGSAAYTNWPLPCTYGVYGTLYHTTPYCFSIICHFRCGRHDKRTRNKPSADDYITIVRTIANISYYVRQFPFRFHHIHLFRWATTVDTEKKMEETATRKFNWSTSITPMRNANRFTSILGEFNWIP